MSLLHLLPILFRCNLFEHFSQTSYLPTIQPIELIHQINRRALIADITLSNTSNKNQWWIVPQDIPSGPFIPVADQTYSIMTTSGSYIYCYKEQKSIIYQGGQLNATIILSKPHSTITIRNAHVTNHHSTETEKMTIIQTSLIKFDGQSLSEPSNCGQPNPLHTGIITIEKGMTDKGYIGEWKPEDHTLSFTENTFYEAELYFSKEPQIYKKQKIQFMQVDEAHLPLMPSLTE